MVTQTSILKRTAVKIGEVSRMVRAVLHPAEAITIPGKGQLHITPIGDNVLSIVYGQRIIIIRHRKDKLFEIKTAFDADVQPQFRRAMPGEKTPLVSLGQGDSKRNYDADKDGDIVPMEDCNFGFTG